MSLLTRKQKIFWTLGTAILIYPAFTKCLHLGYRREKDRRDNVAIVTGATGTIGSAVAHSFAQRKMRVILACRNMDSCKSMRRELVLHTNNKKIACRHLDLEDIDSINRFADDMIDNEPHIDIFVNCARINGTGDKQLTKYGIEKHFFVNFLGPYLLIFRLLDKLTECAKLTRDSRIVNIVESPRSRWKIDLNDINFDNREYNDTAAYEQSQLARCHFTILLDKLMRERKSNVYVLGCAPISKKIKKHLELPTNTYEDFQRQYKRWFEMDGVGIASGAIRAALDKESFEDSGHMYSYFMRPIGRFKGWGPRMRDEVEGKYIWKFAGDLLIQIGDQLKQEEKSKASVDESA